MGFGAEAIAKILIKTAPTMRDMTIYFLNDKKSFGIKKVKESISASPAISRFIAEKNIQFV